MIVIMLNSLLKYKDLLQYFIILYPNQQMPGTQYHQEFNKQLSEQLQRVRKQQANHIPVYSMKYKNASKYLVEDLKQPLALFPKHFKLNKIHHIISTQSIEYCKSKLKNDLKVNSMGEEFKLPIFHLYTIEIIKDQKIDENKVVQQQGNKNSESKKQKPLGKFVKLDLQMTFEQAFNKYGRENVLTVVYTDAQEVRLKYTKTQKTVQKWLQRILFIVLALIIIPYLMKAQPKQEVQSTSNNNNELFNTGVITTTDNTNTIKSNHIDDDDVAGTNHAQSIVQHAHDDYYYDDEAI